jgi:hypothetical protein
MSRPTPQPEANLLPVGGDRFNHKKSPGTQWRAGAYGFEWFDRDRRWRLWQTRMSAPL